MHEVSLYTWQGTATGEGGLAVHYSVSFQLWVSTALSILTTCDTKRQKKFSEDVYFNAMLRTFMVEPKLEGSV